MGALFYHQTARHHRFANMLAESRHRAIRFPCHVSEQFQRMPAHRVAEQFRLRLQSFAPRRFVEQHRILREEIRNRIRARLEIKLQGLTAGF